MVRSISRNENDLSRSMNPHQSSPSRGIRPRRGCTPAPHGRIIRAEGHPMRQITACLVLTAAILSAQEPKTRTWDVDGMKREAIVFAPAKETATPPLVFVFHGHGGAAKGVASWWAVHKHWPDAV